MVLSFFVSNIITVLGSMMDSFTVSNTMDEAAVAAVGFVSPAVILFSLIGTTASDCLCGLSDNVYQVPQQR